MPCACTVFSACASSACASPAACVSSAIARLLSGTTVILRPPHRQKLLASNEATTYCCSTLLSMIDSRRGTRDPEWASAKRKRRDPPQRSRLFGRHVVGPAASVPLPVDLPSLVGRAALIPPPKGGSPRRFTSPFGGMRR